MSRQIDWGQIVGSIIIGLFIALQIGAGIYAMQSMTPAEKDDFIIQLQQDQMQE